MMQENGKSSDETRRDRRMGAKWVRRGIHLKQAKGSIYFGCAWKWLPVPSIEYLMSLYSYGHPYKFHTTEEDTLD